MSKSKPEMKTTFMTPPSLADATTCARDAHNHRVAATAVRLAHRLGWSSEQQKAIRAAALTHHECFHLPNLSLASRILDRNQKERRQPMPARNSREQSRLIELCCFFVQRWEHAPYEAKTFAEILRELHSLAEDRFFDMRHVRALFGVPAVTRQQIREIVRQLPVFPAVAVRAIELAQTPMASAGQLEELIGSDSVLAGEVLQAANSPSYGQGGKRDTIRQCIVFLGMPECCRILAAAAFRPLFRSPLTRPLWHHSLEVARLCQELAALCEKESPDKAFLAGLLHDVGRLAMWRLPPALSRQFEELLREDCEAMFAEVILCGFDHMASGDDVMCYWRAPEDLREAVANHHQPERTDAPLASIVYLAEFLSSAREDNPSAARLKQACQTTGLRLEQLQKLPSRNPPPVVL